METVEQIVAKLHKSAQLIKGERSSRYYRDLTGLAQSYNEVTGVIHTVIQQYETSTAKRAYKLLTARWTDPYVWREQTIVNALREVTDEHRSEIRQAILASRLPGKSPIRKRPKRPNPRNYTGRVTSRRLQSEQAATYPQGGDFGEEED